MKYIDLVIEVHGRGVTKTNIEKKASILKEKLEAKIAYKKAEILSAKTELREAEDRFKKAKAIITTDIDEYLEEYASAEFHLSFKRLTLERRMKILDSLNEIYEMF